MMIFKHFVSLGVSRRTVFSIFVRFDSGETLVSHWKYPKASKNQACNRVGALRRCLARNVNISKPNVHLVLKKAGVKYYKRQKVPDTTPAQEQRQRTWLRKMSLRSSTCGASIKPFKCHPSSPIEHFWALLKAEVYRGGWQAETEDW